MIPGYMDPHLRAQRVRAMISDVEFHIQELLNDLSLIPRSVPSRKHERVAISKRLSERREVLYKLREELKTLSER